MFMSFIGVAIWGQMLMFWPMVLAMIASIDNHYEDAGASVGNHLPAHGTL